ncbi:MAG: metal-dependent hydrolase [Actinomycetota bacterium]|nr:metal-dependent hydrolase [Actinomycetota bacterium]
MGVAAAIVYVALGRRRIDYRFILAGAVAPDVIDSTLNAAVSHDAAGRSISHAVIAPVVVTVAILLVFRGERRVRVFGLGVGWLLHLVGDGMWQAPRTFLWPAFGTHFSTRPAEPYSWDLLTHPLSHLATWGGELAGLAILLWFAVAFDLFDRGRLKTFLKEGYLRPTAADRVQATTP